MARLTKAQSKAHQQAEALLRKETLTLDEKIFVYENWHESAEHDSARSGAFFTPLEFANDFKIEVHGPKILDLCAGTGVLSFCYAHFRHHDRPVDITCLRFAVHKALLCPSPRQPAHASRRNLIVFNMPTIFNQLRKRAIDSPSCFRPDARELFSAIFLRGVVSWGDFKRRPADAGARRHFLSFHFPCSSHFTAPPLFLLH
jgi:hypothetical protein